MKTILSVLAGALFIALSTNALATQELNSLDDCMEYMKTATTKLQKLSYQSNNCKVAVVVSRKKAFNGPECVQLFETNEKYSASFLNQKQLTTQCEKYFTDDVIKKNITHFMRYKIYNDKFVMNVRLIELGATK